MSNERSYHSDTENHLAHLRRTEGQIRGLQRTILQDGYYAGILTQVPTAQFTFDSVVVNSLKDHTNYRIITAACESGEATQAKVNEVTTAIARLIKSQQQGDIMAIDIDHITELSIDDMTCGHCVMSISEELSETLGVKSVKVTLNSDGISKMAILTDTPLDDATLSDAVSEVGFTLIGIARDS